MIGKVRVSSGGELPERHFLAKPTVAARTTASAHLRPPPRQTGDPQGTPASRWGTTANPSAASAYGLPSFSSPQHHTKCAQPRITYRGTHRGHEPEHALSADDELSQVDSLDRRPALDRTRGGRRHGHGRQAVATPLHGPRRDHGRARRKAREKAVDDHGVADPTQDPGPTAQVRCACERTAGEAR